MGLRGTFAEGTPCLRPFGDASYVCIGSAKLPGAQLWRRLSSCIKLMLATRRYISRYSCCERTVAIVKFAFHDKGLQKSADPAIFYPHCFHVVYHGWLFVLVYKIFRILILYFTLYRRNKKKKLIHVLFDQEAYQFWRLIVALHHKLYSHVTY